MSEKPLTDLAVKSTFVPRGITKMGIVEFEHLDHTVLEVAAPPAATWVTDG